MRSLASIGIVAVCFVTACRGDVEGACTDACGSTSGDGSPSMATSGPGSDNAPRPGTSDDPDPMDTTTGSTDEAGTGSPSPDIPEDTACRPTGRWIIERIAPGEATAPAALAFDADDRLLLLHEQGKESVLRAYVDEAAAVVASVPVRGRVAQLSDAGRLGVLLDDERLHVIERDETTDELTPQLLMTAAGVTPDARLKSARVALDDAGVGHVFVRVRTLPGDAVTNQEALWLWSGGGGSWRGGEVVPSFGYWGNSRGEIAIEATGVEPIITWRAENAQGFFHIAIAPAADPAAPVEFSYAGGENHALVRREGALLLVEQRLYAIALFDAADASAVPLEELGEADDRMLDVAAASDGNAIWVASVTESELRVSTDADGSWFTQVVDDEGTFDAGLSLDVSSQGRVAVAYFDATNEHVKLAVHECAR